VIPERVGLDFRERWRDKILSIMNAETISGVRQYKSRGLKKATSSLFIPEGVGLDVRERQRDEERRLGAVGRVHAQPDGPHAFLVLQRLRGGDG